MAKKKETQYNIRLIDHGDGTYSLGFISRLRKTGAVSKRGWVDGSRNKVIRLLTKGTYQEES